jgi:hypothetical protein
VAITEAVLAITPSGPLPGPREALAREHDDEIVALLRLEAQRAIILAVAASTAASVLLRGGCLTRQDRPLVLHPPMTNARQADHFAYVRKSSWRC